MVIVGLAAHYHLSLARIANASLGEGRDRRKRPSIFRRNCMNRMGTWNVRGINVEEKRREVMDVFRKGKFDLLTVTETKMKGNGENEWCSVKCVCAGVERNERGREGVAILMSDLWYRAMEDFVCVSPRILMVKFKFEKVKVCVVVTYGPSEGNVEELSLIHISEPTRLLSISYAVFCLKKKKIFYNRYFAIYDN